MSIPISVGSGAASVAAEVVAGLQYQQIEILGKGGASTLGVNPDGSFNASIIGVPFVKVAGSIITIPTGNQSVSGVVGIGGLTTSAGLDDSTDAFFLLGTDGFLDGAQLSSRGYVFNGTNWDRQRGNSSIGALVSTGTSSVITILKSSSIIAVATGSVVTIPSGNQSVSGALFISGSVLLGSSNGSVFMMQQAGSILATSATLNPGSVSGAINVSGSVLLGSSNASVISLFQNSSIIAINAGSVVGIIPGSVITVWKDSSVLSVPVGSTVAVLQAPSIVGTYAGNAAHTIADKGVFSLNVRNDTLASVTSTDGNYAALSVGPSGEGIVANAPLTKWVQGTADFRQGNAGASIIVIATGGTSIFTYITGAQVANMGSASVLVTLASGGSTLGYTIAPAGGGSNIYYPNALKTPANFGFAASLSGIASVLVSAQGFISKS